MEIFVILLFYKKECVFFPERFQGKTFILSYWWDRRIICEVNVYLSRQ